MNFRLRLTNNPAAQRSWSAAADNLEFSTAISRPSAAFELLCRRAYITSDLYAMIQETKIEAWRKTMTITTEAIYEQGVLKLSQPIPLAEGTRVEVIVISTKIFENHAPREILAKIAALPLEGKSDEFSGQDHDKVLYPPSNAT